MAAGPVVGFPVGPPTLGWYEAALSDPEIRRALLLFVGVALASAFLAVLVGPAGMVDAARDLGAGPVRVLTQVVAPWLRPALLGAFLLAAPTSFGDFIRSFFLGGYDPTLPVPIFGRLHSGLTPEINAVATLVLLVTFAIAAGLRMADRVNPALASRS